MPDILRTIRGAGKITRPLDLCDYDPVYQDEEGNHAVVQTCVAPPRELVKRWGEVVAWVQEQQKRVDAGELEDEDIDAFVQEFEDRKLAWFAEMWQDVTLEEARQMREALLEKDPGCWEWLCDRTHEMVREFRESKLKNSRGG